MSDALTSAIQPPMDGEVAYWRCFMCGERQSKKSLRAAKMGLTKHNNATKHAIGIAMGRCIEPSKASGGEARGE